MGKYYAVKEGREGPKIYSTWSECQKNVTGFSGAKFKSFSTEKEAMEYIGIKPVLSDDKKQKEKEDALKYIQKKENSIEIVNQDEKNDKVDVNDKYMKEIVELHKKIEDHNDIYKIQKRVIKKKLENNKDSEELLKNLDEEHAKFTIDILNEINNVKLKNQSNNTEKNKELNMGYEKEKESIIIDLDTLDRLLENFNNVCHTLKNYQDAMKNKYKINHEFNLLEHYKDIYSGLHRFGKELNEKKEKLENDYNKAFEDLNETQSKKRKLDIIKDTINIYTDGSCNGNGSENATGGIGVYFEDGIEFSEQLEGHITNNVAELKAIIKALEIADEKYNSLNLIIHSDSEYVLNGISGVNKIHKNPELFDSIKKLVAKRKGTVEFKKVKGHSNNYGNDRADELSKRRKINN